MLSNVPRWSSGGHRYHLVVMVPLMVPLMVLLMSSVLFCSVLMSSGMRCCCPVIIVVAQLFPVVGVIWCAQLSNVINVM